MNQDIQASLQLINTYRDIIKSPTVLDEVVSNLELQESSSAISNKIEVSNQDQSQVLTVTVTDESAQRAEYIANEVASVFQNTVPEVMNVDNVSVLVTNVENNNRDTVLHAKDLLEKADANIIGVVLNNKKIDDKNTVITMGVSSC